MENFHDPKQVSEDDDGPVVIGNYTNTMEAYLARAVLEQAGIQCFLYDQNRMHLSSAMINLQGGMRLVVAAADAENAKNLLSQTGEGKGAPLR